MHLKSLWPLVALTMGLTVGSAARAEAPAGSSGECKDGTYTSAANRKGACAAHGGVKDWYGKSKSATTAKPAEKVAVPAAEAAPAKPAAKTTAMPTVAAAGGGQGKVWVNKSSKVYHCNGDEWYGKTKHGAYMSEAAAKAKGNHAANKKACS